MFITTPDQGDVEQASKDIHDRVLSDVRGSLTTAPSVMNAMADAAMLAYQNLKAHVLFSCSLLSEKPPHILTYWSGAVLKTLPAAVGCRPLRFLQHIEDRSECIRVDIDNELSNAAWQNSKKLVRWPKKEFDAKDEKEQEEVVWHLASSLRQALQDRHGEQGGSVWIITGPVMSNYFYAFPSFVSEADPGLGLRLIGHLHGIPVYQDPAFTSDALLMGHNRAVDGSGLLYGVRTFVNKAVQVEHAAHWLGDDFFISATVR